MARLNPLKRDEMNEAQARAYDAAKAKGGRLGGPNGIYIRVPELFELHQGIGNALAAGPLSPRLRQLAILAAARHWEGEYPWGVQARAALAMGIERTVVDAINEGRRPAFNNGDDETAYAVATELVRHGTLSDASFATAKARLGFDKLLVLVATVGFYTSVALVTNVYEVDPPTDIPVPLKR